MHKAKIIFETRRTQTRVDEDQYHQCYSLNSPSGPQILLFLS